MDKLFFFTSYLYLFMLNNTAAAVHILKHSGKSKSIKYICNVSIFPWVINNWFLVSKNTGQWIIL